MAVKFPLKMAGGTMVRTIEELREHFDLTAALAYYKDGRLTRWLENGYYDEEARKVAALDTASDNIAGELCAILGVSYSASELEQADLGKISKRHERIEQLKQYTVDDAILAAVDRVAFTQEELDNLVSKRPFTTSSSVSGSTFTTATSSSSSTLAGSNSIDPRTVIYLCGEHFTIPGDVGGITYVGINSPTITLAGEEVAAGMDFQDIRFDFTAYIDGCADGSGENYERFFQAFDRDQAVGVKLLQSSNESSSTIAQAVLAECYMRGFGVEKDEAEAVKWLLKAAEQGNAMAQAQLGHCYRYGEGVERDMDKAVRWTLKAANQGNPTAQTRMGIFYENGLGVEKDVSKAVSWYQKAAQQGAATAQYYLGLCYGGGKGIAQDKDAAVQWLKKALDQGVEKARPALMETAPQLFKLSDVIKYAIGGEENLGLASTFEKESGEIHAFVLDRTVVNETVLRNLGASSVSIEPQYQLDVRERPMIEKVARNAGRAAIRLALGGPVIGAWAAHKAIANEEPEIVSKDTGGGWVHIQMKIDQDMADDLKRMMWWCEPDPGASSDSVDFGDLRDIFGSFSQGDDSKEGDT